MAVKKREYLGVSRKFRLYDGPLIFLCHSTSTMTSVQHDVNDMDDVYHANRDCREDSRRDIPIAKGKIEIAIGKVIYLPANERTPSFRHQYFFFRLTSLVQSDPCQYFHILSAAHRMPPRPEKSTNFYNTKALGRIALTVGINRAWLSPTFPDVPS